MNQHVNRIQEAWEKQDSQIAATSLFRPGPANHEPYVDNGQEDLHTFLVKKIKNIQEKRSDPDEIFKYEHLKNFGEEKRQFKASTLTNIAQLKAMGPEHLENQFIDRLFKQ